MKLRAVGILALLLLGAAPAVAAPSFDEQFAAAQAHARDGRHDEAIAAYTALLRRSPRNADVLLGRGLTYSWLGRWREAEDDLTAATRAAPRYADAWSALGDVYRRSGRPEQAAQAYGRWIEIAPDRPAPYLARGRVRRASGDADGARADFEAAAARGAPAREVAAELRAVQPGSLPPDAVATTGYRWSASATGTRTWLDPDRSDQTEYGLTLRRHFEHGSLAVEALGAHRFGRDDEAWALDGYVGLWSRAYANVRYQHGPDAVLFPEHAGRVEVYQGFGSGWEAAASIDRLVFRSSAVNLYGIALGKYVGNYFLRGRALYVPGDDGDSLSFRALARYYYYGDADSYVEASGGTGRSEDATTGFVSERSSNSSVGLALVHFFSPRWGFKLGTTYSDEPDHTERSVTGVLYRRW